MSSDYLNTDRIAIKQKMFIVGTQFCLIFLTRFYLAGYYAVIFWSTRAHYIDDEEGT
jgi:hypothetical protein